MEFKTDILLKHSIWNKATKLENELKIFSRLVDIYIVACTIGVADDEIVENDTSDIVRQIARNTLATNYDVNELLSFIYQNAILSTKKINISVDERKAIAFSGEQIDSKLSPSNFLVPYATYGMIKLCDKMTNHDVESIENLLSLIEDYRNKLFDDIDNIEI